MTDPNAASPTIVIVNDDVIQLRVLSGMLERENFNVLAFDNARDALDNMDPSAPPELIITDLYMPGIDGWRFCRLLRSMEYAPFNTIPILLVSATFSGEDVREITAKIGADAFLPAPIRATTFIKQVNCLLAGGASRIKTRVLIVDPDTTESEKLKAAFEYAGYHAATVDNGMKAAAALRKDSAEIIILEYELPDASGDRLLEELRQIHPLGVFIITTHDPRPELAVGCMHLGAAAFVRKPFDPSYLITLCENACRERALLHVEDILEDRTRELLNSEARYRFIYDNSPVMMHSIDEEGKFCDVNGRWLAEMGYEREEVIGRNAYFMLAPDPSTPEADSERKAAFEEQRIMDFPCRLQKKDGSVIDVLMSSETVENNIGKKISICVVRDVTRQKQMENERLHLESQIQKFEGLNLMAGSIAHNFNNLLMGVIGNLEMATAELDPNSPIAHNVQTAVQAATRASELSSMMLTYAGRGQISSRTINLVDLVERMISVLATSIKDQASIEFTGGDKPIFIKGDSALLDQAILNVVFNAAESYGDSFGRIMVSVGTVYHGRETFQPPFRDNDLPQGIYAYVEITDMGCGMSPDTRARAFDPFFTTKFTGRGLGLSAVLGIAKAHRGAVSIDTRAGKGSSVKLLFPELTPEPEPEIKPGTKPGTKLESKPETKTDNAAADEALPASQVRDERPQGTVLLVDDETIILDIGKEMLASLGFQVLTAKDGIEAVRVFRERINDIVLVLLDLSMPHMDGEKAFHQLRKIDPTLKIILSSGYTEDIVAPRFKTIQPDGFIQKPYQLNALRDKISAVLSDL